MQYHSIGVHVPQHLPQVKSEVPVSKKRVTPVLPLASGDLEVTGGGINVCDPLLPPVLSCGFFVT